MVNIQKPIATETLPRTLEQLEAMRRGYTDRVVPVSNLRWSKDRLIIDMPTMPGSDPLQAETTVSRVALDQMLELVKVPKTFGRTCPADLRENIINRMLQTVPASQVYLRLIQKNGGNAHLETRAILPQNFEPFDFADLAAILTDVSNTLGRRFEIDRGSSPDKNLESWNIRLIDPDTATEIDEPEEKIFMGLDARTSEVGLFNPAIEPVLYQLICTNGLKAPVVGDGENADMLRFRYYKVNRESIVERICAYINQLAEAYVKKQELFRNASKSRIRADVAEDAYMQTLINAHVAGGAAHREELMNRLRSQRSQNGDYSVYRVVSTLTEIARDHSRVETEAPESDLNRVDTIERGAGRILEQYAAVA